MKFFAPQARPISQISMTFCKTKGTEGLFKLTKFSVAMLIFGDIRKKKQPKHFAANKRPVVMHWLLANACVFLVNDLLSLKPRVSSLFAILLATRKLPVTITKLNRIA